MEEMTLPRRLYSLLALGFVAIYLGTMAVNDAALHKGSNVVLFIFLYFVGNTLRTYQDMLKKISYSYLVVAYLLLNAALVWGYCIFGGGTFSHAIYRLSFPYNSPLMVLNASLLFLIVTRYSFRSKVINWLASSALAIYLITESRYMIEFVFYPIVTSIKGFIQNDILVLATLSLLALLVMIICILIDKLLSPLWRWFAKMGGRGEQSVVALASRL